MKNNIYLALEAQLDDIINQKENYDNSETYGNTLSYIDADDEERINNSNYTDSYSIQSWIDGLVTNALEGKSNYERIRVPSRNYIYYKPEYLLTAIPSSGECFGVLVESDESTTDQLIKDVKQIALNNGIEEVSSESFLNNNDYGGFINPVNDTICELSNYTIGSSIYSNYHNRFAVECVRISENYPQKSTKSGVYKIEEINELAESYKNTVGEYPERFLSGANLSTQNTELVRSNNETYEVLHLAINNPYSGDYFYKKEGADLWIYTSCISSDNGVELIGEDAKELFVCDKYNQMINSN